MRFCVAGSVKQGRWEPDRFHQTKALSLGFGFCGCFCWSWGKVWQTEECSQNATLHAEMSSNTFPCKSPQSRRQRENEPALNEQLSAQCSPVLNRCQTVSHPSLLDMNSNGQRSYVQYGQTYVRINSKQKTTPQFPLRPEINILWVCLAVHGSHEFIKMKFC